MPPHPPPCHANEILIGNTCFPTPNLNINPGLTGFDFALSNVHPDALSAISGMVGVGAEMTVKKTGPNMDITISAVPHADADNLLKALRPNDPDAKLP